MAFLDNLPDQFYKPDTIDGYTDVQAFLGNLKLKSVSQWMEALRWYCQHDLFYLLNFILSDGTLLHSKTKEFVHYHDYYLKKCRATEYHALQGVGLDYSGRSKGKSIVRSKAFPIMMILNYQDIAMMIFSVEKRLAQKHASLIRQELQTNKRLITLFPEVLWQDPKKETMELGLPWSAEEGFCVKRTQPRRNATVEVHAVFGGGPIGSRPDIIIIDDIESSAYVNSAENIHKLKSAFSEAVTLATPVVIPHQILMMSNTQFSEAGLVKSKIEQYEKRNPGLVIGDPAEDLAIPGNGPCGGTPQYPATAEYLQSKYDEMEVKEEYLLQFCLSYKSQSSFDESLLNFYPEDPKKIASNCVTYICIDASRGVYDPTGIWVWGIDPIGHKWWLDGVRRKLDPTKPEFITEIETLLEKWQHHSQRVVQIRVDQLGNQPWAELIKSELMRRGVSIVPVIPCTSKGKNSGRFDNGKNERIYQFWSPMLNRGEVHFPTPASSGGIGISYFDEEGKQHCLVDYFLKYEYGMFPRSKFDDMLDAGALIEEDKANKEHPLQRGSDRINNYRGVEATRRVSGLSWKSSY